MIEHVVVVSPPNPMIGIVTEPAPVPSSPPLPTVILLNAGLLHRVGPNRTYVEIARSLAAVGFPTLRIDVCGLGDSGARRDSLSFEETAADDARRAMDYLREKRGARSFILGGLCSGADNAFRVAVVDSRVSGAILLDWYAYPTVQFYIRHYGPRLFRASAWSNKVVRLMRRLRGRPVRPPGQAEINPTARPFSPKAEIARQLRDLLQRGVELLCVYTAGALDHYNYPRQFQDMFGSVGLNGQVRTEFLQTSDHAFTLSRHQACLRETITSWATSVDWARLSGHGGGGSPSPEDCGAQDV